MSDRREYGASLRGLPALTIATLTMYGGAALLLLVSAATWEPGRNPRWVILALAGIALAFTAYTAWHARAFTQSAAVAMTSVQFIAIGALTWNTQQTMAAYANGSVFPLVAIYVVWFLHPVVGRVLLYAGVGWWFAAVTHHDDASLVTFAATTVVQAVLAAEVFGRIKARMDHVARTDPLTGLLNRRGIHEVAERELRQARRRGQDLSIVAFDLDGLRDVNNTLGHRAGDELLEAVSRHWSSSVRRSDAIGRIGGDEFLLVLPGTRLDDAQCIVERMALEAPGSWSAGVATAEDGDTIAAMLERADRLMYLHKVSRQS